MLFRSLVLVIAEVTVVSIYVKLCGEDYNWWWHSFLVGGGSSVWIFAYCCWYYVARLHIQGWVSGLLFFGYCGMACVVYGLLTGTVGFLTGYAFVRRIYGYVFLFPFFLVPILFSLSILSPFLHFSTLSHLILSSHPTPFSPNSKK